MDTSSATLLPAHLEAITLCWNEALAKAPVAERLRLVSFLIQLRPHFPSWRSKCRALENHLIYVGSLLVLVLTWDVIIDTLMEDDFDHREDDSLRDIVSPPSESPSHPYIPNTLQRDHTVPRAGGAGPDADTDMTTLRVSQSRASASNCLTQFRFPH